MHDLGRGISRRSPTSHRTRREYDEPVPSHLYASDFSPASRPAFRRALALARSNRAVLTVAHVYSMQIR